MGRNLKRVPLDFDFPLKQTWPGYVNPISGIKCDTCKGSGCKSLFINDGDCSVCKGEGMLWASGEVRKMSEDWERIDPPTGDGYQLWETTSEGSAVSPVFETLNDLCIWCETNATTFGSNKATRDQWKSMLESNFVHHQEGRMIFI